MRFVSQPARWSLSMPAVALAQPLPPITATPLLPPTTQPSSCTPPSDQPQTPPQPTPPAAPQPMQPSWLPQGSAQLQVLDKVNAQNAVLTVKVGQAAQFGSLTIQVQACNIRPPDQPQDSAAYPDDHRQPRGCAGLPRLDAGEQPVAVDAAAPDLRRARRRLPDLTDAVRPAAAATGRRCCSTSTARCWISRRGRTRWWCRRACRTCCAHCGDCWATRSPSSPAARSRRSMRCLAMPSSPWRASMAARSATHRAERWNGRRCRRRPRLACRGGASGAGAPRRAAGAQGARLRAALSGGARCWPGVARGAGASAGRLRRSSNCCRRTCCGRCARAAPTRARRCRPDGSRSRFAAACRCSSATM